MRTLMHILRQEFSCFLRRCSLLRARSKKKRCELAVVRRFWDPFMAQQMAALQSGIRQAPMSSLSWSSGGLLLQMQPLRVEHTAQRMHR